jgi:predicted ATPase
MLETIRAYAADRLQESGAVDEWRDRHATHHASLAEQAHVEMLAGGQPTAHEVATSAFFGGPNEIPALERLATDRDNLTAALGWSVERGDAASAVALALNLGRLWIVRGPLADGRRWTERVIRLDGAQDVPAFPWLLTVASEFPRWQGDFSRARDLLERAVSGLTASGEEARLDAANFTLANVFALQKDFPRSRALSEAALARGRAARDSMRIWLALNALGVVAFYEGDYERMAAVADEELQVAHRSRSPNAIQAAAHNAAEARRHLGDPRRAAALYEESLTVSASLGDDGAIAESLDGLGDVAAALGDVAAAIPLWAAAQRILDDAGMTPWDPEGQRQGITAAREALGAEAFEAQWRAGLALTTDDAIARASAVAGRAAAS